MRLIIVSALTIFSTFAFAKEKTWQEQSDEFVLNYAKDIGEVSPESASATGFAEYDKLGSLPSPEREDAMKAYFKKWEKLIQEAIVKTDNKDLKVDYSILLDDIGRNLEMIAMGERIGLINFAEVSSNVFGLTRMLVNDQTSDARKKAAVDRFKFYMNPGNGRKNLIQASKDEFLREEKKYGKNLVYPYKNSVEKYLSDSPVVVKGLEKLLQQTGRDDWKSEYETYKKEIIEYDKFIKEYVLPKARLTPQQPYELYFSVSKVMA